MFSHETSRDKKLNYLQESFIFYLRSQLNSKRTKTEIHPKVLYDYLNALPNSDNFCNRLMQIVYRVFRESVQELQLTREQQHHFIEKVREIECVKECLDAVVNHLAEDASLVNDGDYSHTFGLEFLLEELEDKLRYIIKDKYEITDERVYNQDLAASLPVRRMNSLARIFRLTDKMSVCNSVALCGDELILSFNMSDNKNHHEMKDIILGRLRVLEQHLEAVKLMTQEEYHECFQQLNLNTYQALREVHPCAFGSDLVCQAIDKLTDAIFFNDTPLTADLRRVFLNGRVKVKILLPLLEDKNKLSIMCNDQVYPTDLRANSVSFAHTEQVLAYYLFNIKKIAMPAPLLIGITKLCCKTCYHNLQGMPVTVYGAHGQSDPNTLCFFADKLKQEPGTPKKHETMQPCSPNSAVKRRESLFNQHGDKPKRPNFDAEEENGMPDLNEANSKRRHHDDSDDCGLRK